MGVNLIFCLKLTIGNYILSLSVFFKIPIAILTEIIPIVTDSDSIGHPCILYIQRKAGYVYLHSYVLKIPHFLS